MVKITYSPIKEIIIHEMVEYSLNDFVKLMTDNVPAGNISPSVKWCDGMAFMSTGLPSTVDVVKDQMAGIIHWAWFAYAEMQNYKPIIETASKVVLPVVDVSNNDLNKNVVDWVRKNRKLPVAKASLTAR